jgi:Holliday junction resolvasome RuvABC endonuclease subunit
MKTLALDMSTKTGWALFDDKTYVKSGYIAKTLVKDFNVNKDPNKSPVYPYNLIEAAEEIARNVMVLVNELSPDKIVIENTVRGRNRHTQRLLEFMHFAIIKALGEKKFTYMDPSQWRFIVGLKMSNEDKKKNKAVNKKELRGKITKKHLAIRKVKELYGLDLLVKENDRADAILLGVAYTTAMCH